VEYLAPVTFTIPTDAGDIEGVAAGSTCAAGGIAWYAASDYATPLPAGVVAPFGVSTYSLCIPSPGGTLTVTLTLPAPVATVFKANAEDEWGEFDAVIDGNTLTLTLTDGGAGDYDGSVNGEIMDPVAPGFVLSLTG